MTDKSEKKTLLDCLKDGIGEKGDPWLSINQKRFCRLYIKYEEDYAKAAREVYPNNKKPTAYGWDLVTRNPRTLQYIAYLREDAYENVLTEDGRQALSITHRAREYIELIKEAREKKRYADAASLKLSLDKLVGRKKRQSFNLVNYKTVEHKKMVLEDALANGEIDDYEFIAMSKSLHSAEVAAVIDKNNRILERLENSDNSKESEKTLSFNFKDIKEVK